MPDSKVSVKNYKNKTLLLISLVSVIVVATLSGFFVNKVKDILTETAKKNLLEVTMQSAYTIEESFKFRLEDLSVLTSIEQLTQDIPLEEKIKYIKHQADRQSFSRIFIADTKGNAISNDGIKIFVGDRDYYQQAMKGVANVSDAISSRVSPEKDAVLQAVPIIKDNKIYGVIFAGDYVENMTKSINNIYYSGQAHIIVIDKVGTMVAQSDPAMHSGQVNFFKMLQPTTDTSKLAALYSNIANGIKSVTSVNYANRENFIGAAPITNSNGWTILISVPTSIVLAQALDISRIAGLLVAVIILIFVAIAIYITRIERAYVSQLKISDYRYKVITEQTGNIVFDWDITEHSVYYSPGWYQKFDYIPPIQGDIGADSHVFADDRAIVEQAVADLHAGRTIKPFDIRVHAKDGSRIWINVTPTTIYDDNKKPIRVIGLITDITEKKIQEQQMQYKANTDVLSGLCNRRAFEERSIKAIEKAHSDNTRLAFLFVDIDDFRYFNNNFGHAFGDRVIHFIGESLKEFSQHIGFAGRNGGDEFIVCITDETSIKNVEYITGRLQAILKEGIVARESDPNVSVGCSIGIVLFPDSAQNYVDLIKKADDGMYKAKAAGKGRYYMIN